jgi:hypothetical protein
MLVVDDDGGHRSDPSLGIKLLALSHFGSVGVAGQNLTGGGGIQASGGHASQQNFSVLHALSAALIGLQERLFQGTLRTRPLALCPMQQAVGVEGVVNPATTARVEFEPHLGTPIGNRLANLSLLFRRRSVLLREVFTQVLAARPHVWVQLKGLKVQIGLYLTVQIVQGFFQCPQAHGAPGTGNVRYEINFQSGGHGALSSIKGENQSCWLIAHFPWGNASMLTAPQNTCLHKG